MHFPVRVGRFTGNVATTLLAQIANLILTVAINALLISHFGASGKGILDLALLVPQILGILLGFGVGWSNVFYMGTRRFSLANLTSNSMAIALIATALGFTLVIVSTLTGLLAHIVTGVSVSLILLAMIGLPIIIITVYFSACLQGANRIHTINILLLVQSATTLGMNVLLVIVFHRGLGGAIVASIVGSASSLGVMSMILHRMGAQFHPRMDPNVVRPVLSFATPGYLGNVMQILNYRLDAFLVNAYRGTAEVGIYGIAARVAELLLYLPNAVSFVIFPKATSSTPRQMNAFTPRVFWYTLALTGVGAVALALVGRQLIVLIFSQALANAYTPLLLLLPGVVFLGGAKVLTNEMVGRGYPHLNACNSAISLVLTISLDLALIPRYGMSGAAFASSIAYTSYLALAIGFYLSVRRRGVTTEEIG